MGLLFRVIKPCPLEEQGPAPRLLNTFGRLYLLRCQVVVVANADVLHHAPDAPPLKDANARLPHVVNLGGKHLSESVAAVLNVGPL